MKYSIILGNVGSCCDRYMTDGYGKPFDNDELFERLASIDHVEGVELIGGSHITVQNVPYIRDKLKEYHLKPVAIIPDHFSKKKYGKGAFTSPDAEVRKQAVEETLEMARAAKEIGCDTISIWNGQDGFDYPMQANYVDASMWLREGVAECARRIPDVRFSLEYKPKEPRNHCFLPNVWASIVYAKECGMPNVGVTIDVGHSFEAYENAADAVCAAATRNLLFHMHINDNYRLWDDDMMTGSIHTIEFIEIFYWLKKLKYDGYISVDQYPYREDGRDAAEQSIKWLIALEKAAGRIDHEKMEAILAKNDAVASTEYLRQIIFG